MTAPGNSTSTREQAAGNRDHVRRLLRERQPEFAAALELALLLAEQEITS